MRSKTHYSMPPLCKGGCRCNRRGDCLHILPIFNFCKMIVLQSLTRFAGAPFLTGSLFRFCSVDMPRDSKTNPHTWETNEADTSLTFLTFFIPLPVKHKHPADNVIENGNDHQHRQTYDVFIPMGNFYKQSEANGLHAK